MGNTTVNPSAINNSSSVMEARVDYTSTLATIREVFSGKEDTELPRLMKGAGLVTASKAGKELKGSALVPSLRAQLDRLDEEGIVRVALSLRMPLAYLSEETPDEGFDRLEREAETFSDSVAGDPEIALEASRAITEELPTLEEPGRPQTEEDDHEAATALAMAAELGAVSVGEVLTPAQLGDTPPETLIAEVADCDACPAGDACEKQPCLTVAEQKASVSAGRETEAAEMAQLRAFEAATTPPVEKSAGTEGPETARGEAQTSQAEAPVARNEVASPAYPRAVSTSWGEVVYTSAETADVTVGAAKATTIRVEFTRLLKVEFEALPSLTQKEIETLTERARMSLRLAQRGPKVEETLRGHSSRMAQKHGAHSGQPSKDPRQVAFQAAMSGAWGANRELNLAAKVGDDIAWGSAFARLASEAVKSGGDRAAIRAIASGFGIQSLSLGTPPTPAQKAAEASKAPVPSAPALPATSAKGIPPAANNKPVGSNPPANAPTTGHGKEDAMARPQTPKPAAQAAIASTKVTNGGAPTNTAASAPVTETEEQALARKAVEAREELRTAMDKSIRRLLEEDGATQAAMLVEVGAYLAKAAPGAIQEELRTACQGGRVELARTPTKEAWAKVLGGLSEGLKVYAMTAMTAMLADEHTRLFEQMLGSAKAKVEARIAAAATRVEAPAVAPVAAPEPAAPAAEPAPAPEPAKVEAPAPAAEPEVVEAELVDDEPAKPAPDAPKADKKAKEPKKPSGWTVGGTFRAWGIGLDIAAGMRLGPIAREEELKAMLAGLRSACGDEKKAFLSPTGTGLAVDVTWSAFTAASNAIEVERQDFFTMKMEGKTVRISPWLAKNHGNQTLIAQGIVGKVQQRQTELAAIWSRDLDCRVGAIASEAIRVLFSGEDGGEKAMAIKVPAAYTVGRLAPKDERFLLKGWKPEITDGFKAFLEAVKTNLKGEAADVEAVVKGVEGIKDEGDYLGLRRQVVALKVKIRALKESTPTETSRIAKLEQELTIKTLVAEEIDSQRGYAHLKGDVEDWKLQATGVLARDLELVADAIVATVRQGTNPDGTVRLDRLPLCGEEEMASGKVGRLVAQILVMEAEKACMDRGIGLAFEHVEVLDAVRTPEVLEEQVTKPGFRGVFVKTTWGVYVGARWFAMNAIGAIRWILSPVVAVGFAARGIGKMAVSLFAKDKAGWRAGGTKDLTAAKEAVLNIVRMPVALVKGLYEWTKGLFGKSDAKKSDSNGAKAPNKTADKAGKESTVNNAATNETGYVARMLSSLGWAGLTLGVFGDAKGKAWDDQSWGQKTLTTATLPFRAVGRTVMANKASTVIFAASAVGAGLLGAGVVTAVVAGAAVVAVVHGVKALWNWWKGRKPAAAGTPAKPVAEAPKAAPVVEAAPEAEVFAAASA